MLQKILIILNLVVALGGVGAIYYSHFLLKPAPTDQVAETEAMKTSAVEESSVAPVPLKKFVINLYSKTTRLRYLDLEMNILPFSADQVELIKANEYLFKDVLIDIGSKLEPEELDSVTGKILLENKIKKQVNAEFRERGSDQPVVKQIFFSSFVVQ